MNIVEDQIRSTENSFRKEISKKNNIDIHDQLNDSDFEENCVDVSTKMPNKNTAVFGEISKNLDNFKDPPNEETVNQLVQVSNIQSQNVSKIIKKVCVAPGEQGQFQNWGEDSFLEEKCFPELFPYGTSGYLSSCIEDP